MKRIFVVGCARSGTTFLQSLLAAHPRLTSYPETHFWDYTIPKKLRFRYPKIYTEREIKLVREYLKTYNFRLDALSNMKPFYFTYRSWSKALLQILDNLTDDNVEGWIEKTPRHLYSIPFIKVADPDARFVHIIREGKDVVASLYDVSHKYPEQWNGEKSIDHCIRKWINSINESIKYLDNPRHSFVCYEDLLMNKEEVISKICNFIDVEFHSRMIERFTSEAKKLVGESEKWKQNNIKGKSKSDINKFEQIFSEEEKEYILKQTQHISLAIFDDHIKPSPGNSTKMEENGHI